MKRQTAEAEVLLSASDWVWEGRKGEALRSSSCFGQLGGWWCLFTRYRFEGRGGLGGWKNDDVLDMLSLRCLWHIQIEIPSDRYTGLGQREEKRFGKWT